MADSFYGLFSLIVLHYSTFIFFLYSVRILYLFGQFFQTIDESDVEKTDHYFDKHKEKNYVCQYQERDYNIQVAMHHIAEIFV